MLAYLAIIVIPSLALLALGLHSVRRQRDAIAVLTTSNLRLSMERMGEGFERRVIDGGTLALRDPRLSDAVTLVAQPGSAENQRALRRLLSGVAERHPVVSRLLLFQGSRARYPLTQPPLPQTIDALLSGARPGPAAQFARAFEAAERFEAMAGQAARAAASYRLCAELDVPPRLRGIALARAARSYRLARDLTAASRTWQEVADLYGDSYDLFEQPYGVVAAIELRALAETTPLADHTDTAGVLRDLARGRWELTAAQAATFIDQLRQFSPRPAVRAAPSDAAFLSELQAAEALERTLAGSGVIPSGEVRTVAIRMDDANLPILCSRLESSDRTPSDIVTCLAVDVEWSQRVVLPELIGDASGPPNLVAADATRPATSDSSRLTVPLRSVFSGWALTAPAPQATMSLKRLDTVGFGGATLGVVSVLLLGVLLLVRDVSRQAEVARLRSDFVSGVSHQLRTPLTLIRLYAEMLTDYPDASEHVRREHLGVITSESQRLTTLIERVLDFAQVERGKKPYLLVRGDVGSAVQPVADVYASHLRRRGFTVDVRVSADLPPVRMDADAVGDAVVNLVDNAAKYSREGNYVGIVVETRGDEVVLEVADRGPGIPEAERERLFLPFSRGSHHQEKGGYGLGLFLVRHMAEAHGGRAEVESTPAQGCVFRIVFPVDRSM
jgi:signal transduction histidine kinase